MNFIEKEFKYFLIKKSEESGLPEEEHNKIYSNIFSNKGKIFNYTRIDTSVEAPIFVNIKQRHFITVTIIKPLNKQVNMKLINWLCYRISKEFTFNKKFKLVIRQFVAGYHEINY